MEAAEVVERRDPDLQAAGDEYGLCGALRLDAWRHWIEAQAEAAAAAWEQAAAHARNAGAEYERIEILGWIASSLFFGPDECADGIRRCEAILAEVEANLAATADVLQPLAGLHAMQGRFDEARELLATSDAAFEELGLTLSSAVSHHAADGGAARGRCRCRGAEPAQGLRDARGDGRPCAALHHGRVPGAGPARPGPRGARRTASPS